MRCRKRRRRSPLAPPVLAPPTDPPGGIPPTEPRPPEDVPNTWPPEPPAPPTPPAGYSIDSPIAKYSGTFGPAQAERLLWRAGFGPRRGEAERLASLGLERAVTSLTRPTGVAVLTGPPPRDAAGQPLLPYEKWGDDHNYWLDRMIRSEQQLVERMALVFHDWFACNLPTVQNQRDVVNQIHLFRRFSLGSFKDLIHEVTQDPAMMQMLDQVRNQRGAVNENYARELMELFTLGANNFSEQDVREAARALTGWKVDYGVDVGAPFDRYYFEPGRHDTNPKTLFGQTGAFDWEDVCRMVVAHPAHPRFFITKLWSYFIPVPPSDSAKTALEDLYVSSGYDVRRVLEAILSSQELYSGPTLTKPPVVLLAGLLRARGRFFERGDWVAYCQEAGQRLHFPPDVSGWNDSLWLDTNSMPNRWSIAHEVLAGSLTTSANWSTHAIAEPPDQAVDAAMRFWNRVTPLSPRSRDVLVAFGAACAVTGADPTGAARRENALRQLIPSLPDYQVC